MTLTIGVTIYLGAKSKCPLAWHVVVAHDAHRDHYFDVHHALYDLRRSYELANPRIRRRKSKARRAQGAAIAIHGEAFSVRL